MIEREGVIKYSLEFTDGVVAETASLSVLDAWRSIFKDTGLLGEDPGSAQLAGREPGIVGARARGGRASRAPQPPPHLFPDLHYLFGYYHLNFHFLDFLVLYYCLQSQKFPFLAKFLIV